MVTPAAAGKAGFGVGFAGHMPRYPPMVPILSPPKMPPARKAKAPLLRCPVPKTEK